MTNQHCVIIGGTSGIGLALARWHLTQGWQVSIVGSNEEKIAHLTHKFHRQNLNILKYNLENHQEVLHLLTHLNNMTIHRVIYSAGIYYNERKHHLTPKESAKLLKINLQTFQEIFFYLSEQLKIQQTKSQMIAIASVAGLLDFDGSSLYAQCKKSMIHHCQAYRTVLSCFDIEVICIASGYINTQKLQELNQGGATHKPFIISEAQAVIEILHAIDNNIALHIFPKPMKYTIRCLSLLPKPILSRVMRLQYRHQDNPK